MKVLVLGEAIIDEYHSCEAIGKSGKEPVLAARYMSTERSAGGVLACANHLANFCDQVGLVTFLGEERRPGRRSFAAGCKPNVSPTFLYKSNSPTIVKTRFVEKYLSQKLFEVYHMNDDPLSLAEEAELVARARTNCSPNTTWCSWPTTATACWSRGPSTCCAGRRSSWSSTRSRTRAITVSI